MDNNFQKIIEKISGTLRKKKLRLSIAESCTGGFISNALTNLPGASKFFELSVICYSKKTKVSVLGISGPLLKKYGMISEETAVAMAKSVRKLGDTDISLSITGIAGPERIEDKKIGLIYMASATEDLVESKGMILRGSRERIKKQASFEALKFLNQVLRLWL
jgi:PncC family amidohydrolase